MRENTGKEDGDIKRRKLFCEKEKTEKKGMRKRRKGDLKK